MDFAEWSRMIETGMADAERAPDVKCPACGGNMVRSVGLGKLAGYSCFDIGCVGVEVTVGDLSDSFKWAAVQDDARRRYAAREAMRKRNDAHRDHRHDIVFRAFRAGFALRHKMTLAELSDALASNSDPFLTKLWQSELLASAELWCGDCKAYHVPTAEHPRCALCVSAVHAPAPPDLYFDFKGWRFTAPFLCMNCGREICFRQWAFARGCGRCDVGDGPQSQGTFSGPRTLIDPNVDCFIAPERFMPAGAEPLPYPGAARRRA